MKHYVLLILAFFTAISFTATHAIKTVIPMAGLGTRLLPLTKSYSKGMIALIDKPALHHVIDEAHASNITDFCFIINPHEQPILEHYLSENAQLDAILNEKEKLHFIADLNNTIASSTFTYLTQHTPLGLGHAVLQAQPYVQNDNFFCVMLPDNIIENDETILAHLVTLAQQYNASIICVENINPADAHAYGVIQPKTFLTDNLIEIEAIIEKPRFDQGIFTLAQVGRYVFSSDIFDALTVIKPGINGEIQLTDAIAHMMASGKRVLAYLLPGKRHDIGTIRGLLKTTVTLALHNPLYKNMMIEIFNNEINICS